MMNNSQKTKDKNTVGDEGKGDANSVLGVLDNVVSYLNNTEEGQKLMSFVSKFMIDSASTSTKKEDTANNNSNNSLKVNNGNEEQIQMGNDNDLNTKIKNHALTLDDVLYFRISLLCLILNDDKQFSSAPITSNNVVYTSEDIKKLRLTLYNFLNSHHGDGEDNNSPSNDKDDIDIESAHKSLNNLKISEELESFIIELLLRSDDSEIWSKKLKIEKFEPNKNEEGDSSTIAPPPNFVKICKLINRMRNNQELLGNESGLAGLVEKFKVFFDKIAHVENIGDWFANIDKTYAEDPEFKSFQKYLEDNNLKIEILNGKFNVTKEVKKIDKDESKIEHIKLKRRRKRQGKGILFKFLWTLFILAVVLSVLLAINNFVFTFWAAAAATKTAAILSIGIPGLVAVVCFAILKILFGKTDETEEPGGNVRKKSKLEEEEVEEKSKSKEEELQMIMTNNPLYDLSLINGLQKDMDNISVKSAHSHLSEPSMGKKQISELKKQLLGEEDIIEMDNFDDK